MLAVNIQTF